MTLIMTLDDVHDFSNVSHNDTPLYIYSVAARRFQSTKATPEVSTTFLTIGKNKSFSQIWLSDPSTYPIVATLSAAMGLCGGCCIYFLTCNKDVQINTANRNSIIRTWGGK